MAMGMGVGWGNPPNRSRRNRCATTARPACPRPTDNPWHHRPQPRRNCTPVARTPCKRSTRALTPIAERPRRG
eukprot:7484583-Lingulodinium_polyedra.AAC.1